MASRVLVLADHSVDRLNFIDVLEFCRSFATYLQKSVDLGIAPLDAVEAANDRAAQSGASIATIEPRQTARNATVSIAEFIWNEDGSADWGSMWATFTELSLNGGPSVRGPDTPIDAPTAEELAETSDIDAIGEIQRGIGETTGLDSEYDPDEPGWLKVYAYGPKMAAWLAATIILENVAARSNDDVFYVPASPHYTLANQVRSIITVVAKANHYWQEHITAQLGGGYGGHMH